MTTQAPSNPAAPKAASAAARLGNGVHQTSTQPGVVWRGSEAIKNGVAPPTAADDPTAPLAMTRAAPGRPLWLLDDGPELLPVGHLLAAERLPRPDHPLQHPQPV